MRIWYTSKTRKEFLEDIDKGCVCPDYYYYNSIENELNYSCED